MFQAFCMPFGRRADIVESFQKERNIYRSEVFRRQQLGMETLFYFQHRDDGTFQQGILSMDYIDIETRQKIRTFSYPITSELFIFIRYNDVFLRNKNDIGMLQA
jgi:hypothetical protein